MAIRHGTLCCSPGMTLPGWMACGEHVDPVVGLGPVFTLAGLPPAFRRPSLGARTGAPPSLCLSPWSVLSPFCCVCCACLASWLVARAGCPVGPWPVPSWSARLPCPGGGCGASGPGAPPEDLDLCMLACFCRTDLKWRASFFFRSFPFSTTYVPKLAHVGMITGSPLRRGRKIS